MFKKETNKKINLKLGITLVEVLIYTVLLVFVLGLTLNFLYQVANFKLLNRSKSSLFQNSAFIIKKITDDVRSSQGIVSPTNDNFSANLVLQTESGEVTYGETGGVLQRNGEALTDNSVIISLQPPNKGFRKIGQTIRRKIGIKPKTKLFGQPRKEEIYQTTIFFNQ